MEFLHQTISTGVVLPSVTFVSQLTSASKQITVYELQTIGLYNIFQSFFGEIKTKFTHHLKTIARMWI